MPPPKPTVVVVPGEWHEPAHFEPLATALRAKEYKVILVRLPSLLSSRPNQPVTDAVIEDVEAIKSTAGRELNDYPDYDIVILTHSYSSIPGSAACQDLDKLSRRAAGYTNGIAGLLTISGLLIPAGMSVLDCTGGHIPPSIKVWHSTYSVSAAQRWASMLKTHLFEGYRTPVSFAGHLMVPTYYLMCKNDLMLTLEAQRLIVEAANKEMPAGKQVRVTMMDSGHCPFLSRSEETADWIRRCAGEML